MAHWLFFCHFSFGLKEKGCRWFASVYILLTHAKQWLCENFTTFVANYEM